MRTFSFIHFILLLVLVLAYQCAGAQDRVVTVKGDTIKGKIKLINFGDIPKVQVQPEGGKKTSYTLFETKEVVLNNEVYHPQKGPVKYSFMKLLQGGYLSLYAFIPENQNNYDGRLLVKRDGHSIEVPNLTFKKGMKNFLEDCETVVSKLESGEYGKRDLNKIVVEYNACLDQKTLQQKKIIQPAPQVVTTDIAANTDLVAKWNGFSDKVRNHADFEGKSDALEILEDVSKRIGRNEKVPNFLIQGLRSAIKEPDLTPELESLLSEIQKL